jgi:hypothetical protein
MKRKEIRQTLKEVPINELLLVGKSELTHKQREFARQVALGNTGAAAYRKAYDTKAKPKTQGDHASRLKADDRIKAEIEAYQLAIEAAKYRSSAGLRDLVIHSLTQVLIDPDTNAAQRIQAAKVLGTVTEVGAFTERKEVTHVNGSDSIKATIMDQLKAFMLKGSGDVTDIQADDLLAELVGDSGNGDGVAIPDAGDPTHPPPPAVDDETPPSQLHTIPHKESHDLSEPHLSQDPPLPLGNEDTPGGI